MSESKNRDKDKVKDKEKDKNRDIERSKCTGGSNSFSTIAALASNLTTSPTQAEREGISKKSGRDANRLISAISDEFLLKPPPLPLPSTTTSHYKTSLTSIQSEVFSIDLVTGAFAGLRQFSKEESAILATATASTVGTQRVYKKTSPNSILTMYLPTRELVSCGTQPTTLKGILFVDPKSVQGFRVYAQLTLTFRYGREDEEVMGLRFCNEAIMSLYQIFPRPEDPKRDQLTPLQDALIKRLGIGAYPFTLSLSSQSPPSVQLVPAKRYYGAPIGTSYDVRCFIADKTDDKFHRKASVKMGVRVIHKTDVFASSENFSSSAHLGNPLSSPPLPATPTTPKNATASCTALQHMTPTHNLHSVAVHSPLQSAAPTTVVVDTTATTIDLPSPSQLNNSSAAANGAEMQPKNAQLLPQAAAQSAAAKCKKQERVDSFPKIRLSPKSFRFSGRFGRSKSEVERGSCDPFFYNKSFHEVLDFSKPESCGPQGAVDKPFLLQEGRVCLRASLNKSWYTHGENVIVTVNIKNESKKTVRKIRACAIQHVDVCMFNNGKFKNVVADSDNNNLPADVTTVGPGKTLDLSIMLRPKRGPTKNWIALEDSLQRCIEPDEIVGDIAASAVRIPTIYPIGTATPSQAEDRNVFAIYVSYYVKVKLTLSGMGGELSLKLPFSLVHIDASKMDGFKPSIQVDSGQATVSAKKKPAEKPSVMNKANSTGTSSSGGPNSKDKSIAFGRQAKGHASDDDIIDIEHDLNLIRPDDGKSWTIEQTTSETISTQIPHSLERIDSIEDEISIHIPSKVLAKRRLTRSDIRVKDSSLEDNDESVDNTTVVDAIIHSTIEIHSDGANATASQLNVEKLQQSDANDSLNLCDIKGNLQSSNAESIELACKSSSEQQCAAAATSSSSKAKTNVANKDESSETSKKCHLQISAQIHTTHDLS